MGWIRCVRCEKLQRDFEARTFAIIPLVNPFCTEFHAVTKRYQMHPYTMKRSKTWIYGPMGCIECVCCEKFQRDFVAWTFALIALVRPILHRVSCSYETIPNAPKHYETQQKKNLGSNGKDWLRLLPKITTWLCVTNFYIKRTRSTPLDLKLMFWCLSYRLGVFGTISLLHETRCKTGRTSAINAKVHATKSCWKFSKRTHQSTPLEPKLMFWCIL